MKNLTRSLFRISHFAFRIICALLVMLCACGGKGRGGDVAGNVSPALADIDSMMWRQPDSAFVMLQAFASSPSADSLGEFDGHYFHLLLSELLYKNDYAQTNRGELLRAADYFDSLHVNKDSDILAFLDARSHYIKGVGYYETDSVVEACGEYLKALEVMEERFGEKNLTKEKVLFLKLTYTRLFTLFHGCHLYAQAICFGKHSLRFYRKDDDTSQGISWILNELGTAFDMMKQFDSAFLYYDKAMASIHDSSSLVCRDILAKEAYLNYRAQRNPQTALTKLQALAGQSESELELLSRWLCIGEILFQEGMADSSGFYFRNILDRDLRRESRVLAAQHLLEFSRNRGDSSEVSRYSGILSEYTETSDKQGCINTQLTDLFNSFVQARTRHDFDKNSGFYTGLWGLSCVTIVALFVLFWMITKRKKKESEKRHSALMKKEKRKQEELAREIESLKTRHEQEQHKRPIQDYQDLFNESVCVDLRQRFSNKDLLTTNDVKLYSELAINEKSRRMLNEAFEKHCPGFSSTLLRCFPKLNHRDLEYCRLLLIGLSEKEIGVLLQLDRSTVWKRMQRIQQTMETKEVPTALKRLLFDQTNQ